MLPECPFGKGSGCHRVWKWLDRYGKITRRQINVTLRADTARLRSDIRPVIQSYGIDYVVEPIKNDPSNRRYKLVGV